MAKHIAWTADKPGVGELEERDPGEYVGRHRCTGLTPCLHVTTWPIASKPEMLWVYY